MENNYKKCSKCELVKSLDCFYKNNRAEDGLRCRCGDCEKESQAAYRRTENGKKAISKYYKNNKDKIYQVQKEYRETEEGRIASRKSAATYYKKNKEKISLHCKKRYQLNKERIIEKARLKRQENKGDNK